MNTKTGEIYYGERKDKADVALSEEVAAVLTKVEAAKRPEHYASTKFDEWYKTFEGQSETARRDRMRLAFKAGWQAREKEI